MCEPSFAGSNLINFPGPAEMAIIAQGINSKAISKLLIKESLGITQRRLQKLLRALQTNNVDAYWAAVPRRRPELA